MNFDEYLSQVDEKNDRDETQVSTFEKYLELVERTNTRVLTEMRLRKPNQKPFQLSAAKRTMLERLWQEGSPNFPRGFVEGPELYKLILQTDFGRRLRELKDEEGCDIEIVKVGDKLSRYRLNSIELAPGPRPDFSPKQREHLFRFHDFKCHICGKEVEPGAGGSRGAQADHRVPIVRRGPHEFTNWQTLCAGCNVAKRKACEDCSEDCHQCPWAFPEKFGTVIAVGLPKDLYQAALDQTDRRSQPEVGRLLADALQDKLRAE